MLTWTLVCCLVLFISVLSVNGVFMYLNRHSIAIGSSDVNPTMRLVMNCSSSGTFDIDILLQLKLSRRKFTEPTFTDIASMTPEGRPELEPTAPYDIRNRSPNISGSYDTQHKSTTMTLSINAQGIACTDQAEFRCSLKYVNLDQITVTVTDKVNFTVTAEPSEILIDSPEYYDVNGNTLNLSNNSVLNAGTRIKYRCIANVGSFPNEEITWEISSEMPPGYRFEIYVPIQSTDIVQETFRQDGCFYWRTSTMYYNMTKLDAFGISFRCRFLVDVRRDLQYGVVASQQYRSVTAGACLTAGPTTQPAGASLTAGPTTQPAGASLTAGPTTQPGSNIHSSTDVAIVLGLMVGVLVVVIVILSIYLHQYRQELESQKQSRAHTYVGLTETRLPSGQYTVLNVIPADGNVRLDENSYVDIANNEL